MPEFLVDIGGGIYLLCVGRLYFCLNEGSIRWRSEAVLTHSGHSDHNSTQRWSKLLWNMAKNCQKKTKIAIFYNKFKAFCISDAHVTTVQSGLVFTIFSLRAVISTFISSLDPFISQFSPLCPVSTSLWFWTYFPKKMGWKMTQKNPPFQFENISWMALTKQNSTVMKAFSQLRNCTESSWVNSLHVSILPLEFANPSTSFQSS